MIIKKFMFLRLIKLKNMVHKVIIVKDGLIKKDYLNETRIPAAELEDL